MGTLLKDFYLEEDVLKIGKKLLGKILYTQIEGKITAGIIVETESYRGVTDRASHAYNGRFTERTKTLYEEGGIAYVYICYGTHALLNFVTNRPGIPHAVLIRAIEPIKGLDTMLQRREQLMGYTLTRGPGALTKALGITKEHNGVSLLGPKIWVEDVHKAPKILCTTRVGIDYAGEDAYLPWRFQIKDNPWCSKVKGCTKKSSLLT